MLIELRPYDLMIKDLEDGREVVQIRPNLAFNELFINEMKEKGVEKYIEREK